MPSPKSTVLKIIIIILCFFFWLPGFIILICCKNDMSSDDYKVSKNVCKITGFIYLSLILISLILSFILICSINQQPNINNIIEYVAK